MKKYCIFGLMISMIPALCMAEHPRVTELIRIKQDKMAQLEKCSGTTKGLKIAGISTLGVTAVGVAGNIAEAAVINKYDKKIEDTGKKINDTQLEIDQKLKDNIDKQNREDERQRRIAEEQQKQQAAQDESRRLKNVVAQDIATINSRGSTIGDVAASHGYLPEQLPTKIGNNMRSDFADAMINFITKCRKLIGTNGIKEVSLTTAETNNWRNIPQNNVLDENAILTDLNENTIAQCNATECDTTTHTLSNKTCVPNGTTIPDNNGTTPNGDQNGGGTPIPDDQNGDTTPPAPKVGDDCTSQMPDAKVAKIDTNGECIIYECKDINKEPSKGRKTCVEKKKEHKQGDFCDDKDLPANAEAGQYAKDANGKLYCHATMCIDPMRHDLDPKEGRCYSDNFNRFRARCRSNDGETFMNGSYTGCKKSGMTRDMCDSFIANLEGSVKILSFVSGDKVSGGDKGKMYCLPNF